jgi:hypothetical protein
MGGAPWSGALFYLFNKIVISNETFTYQLKSFYKLYRVPWGIVDIYNPSAEITIGL